MPKELSTLPEAMKAVDHDQRPRRKLTEQGRFNLLSDESSGAFRLITAGSIV